MLPAATCAVNRILPQGAECSSLRGRSILTHHRSFVAMIRGGVGSNPRAKDPSLPRYPKTPAKPRTLDVMVENGKHNHACILAFLQAVFWRGPIVGEQSRACDLHRAKCRKPKHAEKRDYLHLRRHGATSSDIDGSLLRRHRMGTTEK